MKREYRDRWCTALRNGPQNLSEGSMYSYTSPCALAMAYIATDSRMPDPDDGEGAYSNFYLSRSPFYLGPRREVAIQLPNGEKYISPYEAVYRMSDTGVPAAQIADWIEANVPVED